MNTKTKHTPIPWAVEYENNAGIDQPDDLWISGGQGCNVEVVEQMGASNNSLNDAKFIVTACNTYKGLKLFCPKLRTQKKLLHNYKKHLTKRREDKWTNTKHEYTKWESIEG